LTKHFDKKSSNSIDIIFGKGGLLFSTIDKRAAA